MSRIDVVIRGAGVLVVAGVLAGGGAYVIQDGGGEPEPGLANIWIDDDGGTCTDNASQVAYSDAAACGTWDAANDTCEGGDTVGVMSGNYADAFVRGDNGRSGSVCTFFVDDGQTVTADDFDVGRWQGSTDGASFVTIIGPMTVKTLYAYTSTAVTFDDIHVDGQFTSQTPQIVNFVDVNATFKNGEIENSCAQDSAGAMMWLEGTAGYTLDNNAIHDAHICDESGAHTECTYFQAADNVTITRNHYYKCAIFDIFVTGEQGDNEADNYTLENNVFEKPCTGGTCTVASTNPAVKTRDGSFPDPHCVDWDVRFNVFMGGLSCNSPSSVTLRGNLFLTDNPCGAGGVTSTYNAFTTGTCGSNSISNTEATYNSGWTGGSARWPMDASLLTGSVLKNVGPTSDYPTLDLPGNSRYDGSAADIGAYEFQE